MSESVVEVSGFTAMGLDPRLIDTLEYKQPSPIQRETIPVLLEGKDLIGLAGTGTGKTAAFALPIIHRLRATPAKKPGVAVLILTPTRELAIQVAKAVKAYGKPVKVDVLAIYGGTGYNEQIRAIRRGVEIIVATPGRALDLIKQGQLPLDAVTTVVLDEADEMLNMGFAEDMDAILSQTPKERQTMLFSATMPPRIEEIAKRHLRNPLRIKVARELPAAGEAASVRQTAYIVSRDHRAKALGRILNLEKPTSAIIFCRTRIDADQLVEGMSARGFKPLALHGGLTQDQRDRVMGRFRSGAADLLIATDIAARGLDIAQLSHVINYDVPTDPDQYVHRIGRVGRAGRTGVAITLATPREQGALNQIERATRQRIVIAPVPTAKDLRASRLDKTRQQLREALSKKEATDDMLGLLNELAKEFTPTDIAVAAMSLLRQPSMPDDETDIPNGNGPREFRPDRFQDRYNQAHGGPDRGRPDTKAEDAFRAGRRPTSRGMSKVFFGIGRDSGVAVRDLVGAIANEAGIPGKDLGVVDLTDRFALVEVPSDVAEYVVEVMQNARIRGRLVNVRADRPPLATPGVNSRAPFRA
ncbi:DEAD/DEAH box helicase [soil metagenome]